jgi:hypothetical protein
MGPSVQVWQFGINVQGKQALLAELSNYLPSEKSRTNPELQVLQTGPVKHVKH